MMSQMFGKKAIGLVLDLFVCVVLIKPIKLFRKKGNSYQTAPAKNREKPCKWRIKQLSKEESHLHFTGKRPFISQDYTL